MPASLAPLVMHLSKPQQVLMCHADKVGFRDQLGASRGSMGPLGQLPS